MDWFLYDRDLHPERVDLRVILAVLCSTFAIMISKNRNYSYLNAYDNNPLKPLMHNVPKWSDTL